MEQHATSSLSSSTDSAVYGQAACGASGRCFLIKHLDMSPTCSLGTGNGCPKLRYVRTIPTAFVVHVTVVAVAF